MPVTIGLDIAKRFFQLHAIDTDSGQIERLKLRRAEVVPFFANRRPCLVAMEACGSSHHWARELQAICEAAQRPEMRFVPVKTEHQQAILCLHSMREGLVKARTAQVHQIRAAFYEFGIELPDGRHWGSTASVAIAPDNTVWAFERCGANSCAGSDLNPIVHDATDGNLLGQVGDEMFQSLHGL